MCFSFKILIFSIIDDLQCSVDFCCMVFILQFVNGVYHTDLFANIEESSHPWDKYHLIMTYNPFKVLPDFVH